MAFTQDRLFHAASALFLPYVDYQMFSVVLEIFNTREDLIRVHKPGLGLQFFTIWNQSALQAYIYLAFLQDVRPRKKLKNFNDQLFMYLLLPSSFVVGVNFWVMYSCLESNMIEDMGAMRHVPVWINHCLHTINMLLPMLEIMVSYKPFPSKLSGLRKTKTIFLIYSAWVVFTRLYGGRWPYPFLSMLTYRGLLLYWIGNMALVGLSYLLGHYMNSAIWGGRNRTKLE